MHVIEAARRSAVAVEADRPVVEVAKLMEAASVGAVAVLDQGAPIGLVTDRDLVRRWLAHHLDPQARIDGIMSSPVVTIPADADLHEAYELFSANAVRRLAIVDEQGEFAGIISVDDLLINLSADLDALVRPVTAEVLFGHHDAGVPAVADR